MKITCGKKQKTAGGWSLDRIKIIFLASLEILCSVLAITEFLELSAKRKPSSNEKCLSLLKSNARWHYASGESLSTGKSASAPAQPTFLTLRACIQYRRSKNSIVKKLEYEPSDAEAGKTQSRRKIMIQPPPPKNCYRYTQCYIMSRKT